MSQTEQLSYTKTHPSRNEFKDSSKEKHATDEPIDLYSRLYDQFMFYWDATRTQIDILWQHREFRLCFYVFSVFAIVPVAVFVLFMLTVISLTSIVLGILWSILVFVSLITGLVILIPVLLVSCLSAIIIVASYALYCHLFEKKM